MTPDLQSAIARAEKAEAERDRLAKACDEWAEVSQRNYQRAKSAEEYANGAWQFAGRMQARASALSAMLAVHVVTTLVIFGFIWGSVQ